MALTQYREIRVLLVGLGSIGRRHAEVLRGIGCENLACADPSEVSRAEFQKIVPGAPVYADFAQALDQFKPEAVFILTPTKLHIPMAIQAVEAGCHVFIEKPLSYTSEGVEELKRLAEEKDRKVMVGFCFRYHDALLAAKRRVEAGEIGRVISIRALMGEPFYQIHPEYMQMYYSKYSGAFDLVHDIDLAIWFAGQEIRRVQGSYGSLSEMGMESPDTVEMLIDFEDRLIASVHLDFFQTPRRRTIDIIGWDGVVQVEFASWDHAELRAYTKASGAWETVEFATERNDMFRAEDMEFLDCVLEDKPMRLTIAEGLKSVKAVEAIYQLP